MGKRPEGRDPHLRYQQGEMVRVVKGIGAGQAGQITAVHPGHDRPYTVLVDAAIVHYTEDSLAPLPPDGP
jgi:transcription antitermination factor NusG